MLLTNFRNTEKERYEKALDIYKTQSGDTTLYIDKNAYWSDGTRDVSMSALRCTVRKDRSDFWNIFRSLE